MVVRGHNSKISLATLSLQERTQAGANPKSTSSTPAFRTRARRLLRLPLHSRRRRRLHPLLTRAHLRRRRWALPLRPPSHPRHPRPPPPHHHRWDRRRHRRPIHGVTNRSYRVRIAREPTSTPTKTCVRTPLDVAGTRIGRPRKSTRVMSSRETVFLRPHPHHRPIRTRRRVI